MAAGHAKKMGVLIDRKLRVNTMMALLKKLM